MNQATGSNVATRPLTAGQGPEGAPTFSGRLPRKTPKAGRDASSLSAAQADKQSALSVVERWRSDWCRIRDLYANGQEERALSEFSELNERIRAALTDLTRLDREDLLVASNLFLTEVYRGNSQFGRVVFRWSLHHQLIA